jgi:hypothetical protein
VGVDTPGLVVEVPNSSSLDVDAFPPSTDLEGLRSLFQYHLPKRHHPRQFLSCWVGSRANIKDS